MSARILVINPNSSSTVTDDIARALAGFHFDSGPVIDCMTLKEGPPGIETQRHVDEVVAPLCRTIEQEQADAFVIACFSDPGLHAAREVASAPVFGIAQCGMVAALARCERFGIVAILETSIPRHRRYVASLGLSDRMAGERAIGPRGHGACAGGHRRNPHDRSGGAALRRGRCGRDRLGCAGMARYRAPLEAHLGCPVIDPRRRRSEWRSPCSAAGRS